MESMTFEQIQEKFKPNTQRLTAQKELDVLNRNTKQFIIFTLTEVRY